MSRCIIKTQKNSFDWGALTSTLTSEAWRRGDLSYKLHDGQLEIYDTLHQLFANGQKEFAFRISRQFGKSYLTVILALEICLRNPGVIVRIAGSTIDSVASIVEDNLAPIIFDAPSGLVRRLKSDKRYLVGKSQLRLGTLERSHIDQTMRGGNAYAIFCEEVAASVDSEHLEYAMKSVIGPQLLHSSKKKGGGLLGFITTPSDNPEHFFHSIIEPSCAKSGTFFTRTVYDNPMLDESQIDLAIKRCGGTQSEEWRREYLCEIFRSEARALVPEWDASIHIVKNPEFDAYSPFYVVADWGGSRDHTHAVLAQYNTKLEAIVIYKEVHIPAGTGTQDIIPLLLELERDIPRPVKSRIVDMFGGQLSVDLHKAGYNCQHPSKSDSDADLKALRSGIASGQLLLSDACTHTASALTSCQWNTSRTDWQRTIKYGHADAIAALVYVWRNVPKKDITPESYYDPAKVWVREHKQTGVEQWANKIDVKKKRKWG